MKRVTCLVFVIMACTSVFAADPRSGNWAPADVVFEVIGQVKNAGTQSVQYGYLPYVEGLSVDQTFAAGGPQDERSAYFTFYNEGTTVRVVTHGLWRIITREGTSTIYYNASPHGDLVTPSPDSFRDGVPVMTSTWRHQVVFEPAPTGHFFVTFVHNITSSDPVTVNGTTIRLGKPGGSYRVTLAGGPDPAGLVNGKFAGDAVAIGN